MTTTCAACGRPITCYDTMSLRPSGAIVCKTCHCSERPVAPHGVPVHRVRRRVARRAATVRIEQCPTSRRWWVIEHSPLGGHTPVGHAHYTGASAMVDAVLHARKSGITAPIGVHPAP